MAIHTAHRVLYKARHPQVGPEWSTPRRHCSSHAKLRHAGGVCADHGIIHVYIVVYSAGCGAAVVVCLSWTAGSRAGAQHSVWRAHLFRCTSSRSGCCCCCCPSVSSGCTSRSSQQDATPCLSPYLVLNFTTLSATCDSRHQGWHIVWVPTPLPPKPTHPQGYQKHASGPINLSSPMLQSHHMDPTPNTVVLSATVHTVTMGCALQCWYPRKERGVLFS